MTEDDYNSADDVSELEDVSQIENPLKRKQTGEQDNTRKPSKSAVKRKKRNAKRAAESMDQLDDVDEELGINRSVARMNASLMADFVARQTKRFETDLSLVELEDRRVPEAAFADSSNWEGERTLESLPPFLEQQCGKSRTQMTQCVKEKGSPHTLVLTASGLRAADLTRALRVYQSKGITVAKLFAKHIKLEQAVESTKRIRMNIGVGTPQRVLDLIEQGALSLEAVDRLVIDGSHINQKRRGILDMRETVAPLTELLCLGELTRRYATEGTRVIVF